jgi:hypothetical protein
MSSILRISCTRTGLNQPFVRGDGWSAGAVCVFLARGEASCHVLAHSLTPCCSTIINTHQAQQAVWA